MRKEIVCPAKINLHLAVGPRELAGPPQSNPQTKLQANSGAYHRICTLLQAIYLLKKPNAPGDTLALELKGRARQSNLRLDCRPAPPPCAEHENLVYRAAKNYLEYYAQYYPNYPNRPEQILFRLTKQIPQQAGLGGGSSDAAAALKLLNQMLPEYCCAPALSRDEVLSIAIGLGADIPFFLFAEPDKNPAKQTGQNPSCSLAWGLEWGQKIVPLARPVAWAVQKWQSRHQLWIVKPKDVSCPTAAMYRLLDKRPAQTAGCYQELEREMARWPDFGRKLHWVLQNDFLICVGQPNAEPPDLPGFVVLVKLLRYLYILRASWVSLCGSGAALFAWFPAQIEKNQILCGLLDFPEELEIFPAHPV